MWYITSSEWDLLRFDKLEQRGRMCWTNTCSTLLEQTMRLIFHITWNIHSLLFYCSASVIDCRPTLKKQWFIVSCWTGLNRMDQYPGKRGAFTQCCFNVGPAQHWNSIGWMPRVCWDATKKCRSVTSSIFAMCSHQDNNNDMRLLPRHLVSISLLLCWIWSFATLRKRERIMRSI